MRPARLRAGWGNRWAGAGADDGNDRNLKSTNRPRTRHAGTIRKTTGLAYAAHTHTDTDTDRASGRCCAA